MWASTILPRARPIGLAAPFGAACASLMGGAMVLAMLGHAMLDTSDPGWMLAGPLGWDPTQYQLAWRFFAQAPWQWPPGLNPDYGLELAGGIFHADAIPLLALPMKLLAPGMAQYWGPWLLACGMLQGFFGWVLMGHATSQPIARVLGAGLLLLQPMLLSRMGGHLALAGQFSLLAALALALRAGAMPARQGLFWAVLVPTTALIHAYLLAMVAAIWAADWLRRAVACWRPSLLVEALALPAACAFALWLSGFFSILGGLGAPGYGHMMLDLAGPFDRGDWGRFLPDLPSEPHPESGDVYLGLGGLGLLLLGAACAGGPWPLRRHWPLLAAVLAMLGFAVSHNATLLGRSVTLFEPPAWLEAASSTLRASERFAWPALYLALVLAMIALGRRLSGAQAALALGLLLALQVMDLRPGLARLHGVMAEAQAMPAQGFAPFWAEASSHYRRIRAVPAANLGTDWKPIASIAAQHRMATDAVYLARMDPVALERLQQAMARRLAEGRHEPGTLYVLRDAPSLALARAAMDPARDMLAVIDGMQVLAPGWWVGRATPAAAARGPAPPAADYPPPPPS